MPQSNPTGKIGEVFGPSTAPHSSNHEQRRTWADTCLTGGLPAPEHRLFNAGAPSRQVGSISGTGHNVPRIGLQTSLLGQPWIYFSQDDVT